MNNQNCPICKCVFKGYNRYPNTICYDCITKYKTLTKDGKEIFFSNVCLFGGFQSKIEGEEQYGTENMCYINNIPCIANEARFGGIIIQKVTKKSDS